MAQVSNSSFDAATLEIWGALVRGGRLVIIDTEVLLSQPQFVRALRTRRISTMFLTTTLFSQLAKEIPDAFVTLRHMLFGGEAVDPASAVRVLEQAGPERLLNGYGPTENTTFTCVADYRQSGGVEDVERGSIGRPIANTRVYVLDPRFELVPLGAEGDLWTAGDGLALGYWKRPKLSAQRFCPDPFSREPGARLYATGDLVRQTADGKILFLGRRDHQVKLRGFRIELGEIETVLSHHPRVATAAVLLREDQPGQRRLVAYLECRGEAPDTDELRRFLQAKLPEYMLPAAFVTLSELPLNRNRKLDRQALPAPEALDSLSSPEHEGPRDPIEDMVHGIWSEVLGHDRLGIHDNFFEHGGHSLLATRVMTRIQELCGVAMPLRSLFEFPTVAELSAQVFSTRHDRSDRSPGPLERLGRSEGPLSFSQQRLWFLDRLEPGLSVYNIARTYRLQGALNLAALERACHAVVARHEVLRTTFPDLEGEPRRRISSTWRPELRREDLTGLGADRRRDEALRRAREHAGRPY
ncbi:MAG: AMP-binding protein, partial [Acidobacteriota bacterium]